jgi:hypothetical protein
MELFAFDDKVYNSFDNNVIPLTFEMETVLCLVQKSKNVKGKFFESNKNKNLQMKITDIWFD